MKGHFLSINFHRETVERFKKTCIIWEQSYTEVLEAMLDFFDRYQLTPFQTYHTTIRDSEINIKKRVNAVVAILKDIEKHQTQPSVSMLQLLFDQAPQKEQQPKLVEITSKEQQKNVEYQQALELIELRSQCTNYQREVQLTKKKFKKVLDKIKITKSNFGKVKLVLDLSPDAFETLKQQIK